MFFWRGGSNKVELAGFLNEVSFQLPSLAGASADSAPTSPAGSSLQEQLRVERQLFLLLSEFPQTRLRLHPASLSV